MAMQTVYLENQVIARETEEVFELGLDQSTRAAMLGQGMTIGDSIAVVDGVQDYFACEIVEISPQVVRVRIAARAGSDSNRPHVHLVLGISNDEAMDTVIRQVSELGVAGVLPYRSTFSPSFPPSRADELQSRWQHLARYSARHAGLSKAPDVGFPEALEQMCQTLAGFDAVLVCWECETARSMADAVAELGIDAHASSDIALVVGPRGGLTDAEMGLIGQSNPRLATVSLGPAILRVETAGLVAPALLISALGGLR